MMQNRSDAVYAQVCFLLLITENRSVERFFCCNSLKIGDQLVTKHGDL
jgi:hypothetical protein